VQSDNACHVDPYASSPLVDNKKITYGYNFYEKDGIETVLFEQYNEYQVRYNQYIS
jgi:hypothetical protein